ncbi:MAG TPA: ArgE/DapE family deacylase [Gammaproteobacteria bacterium]|nr:ArgE/DapE family deacylase [Gammaproteobacteria bacterium]
MTVDTALEARILEAVQTRFDEQLAFTRALVGFPSVRGEEAECQAHVASELRARGYDVDQFPLDVDAIKDKPGFAPVTVSYEKAQNVVARLPSAKDSRRSVILNGHVDVVPPGPLSMWRRPPFEPYIEDGWLYGRGAGDMKAGVGANLFALEALRSIDERLCAGAVFEAVVEEEATGNGTLACVQRGYHADVALITEPMWDRLVACQVGVLWFRVEIRGRPAHVRESETGSNAIQAALAVLNALRELEAQWNAASRRHPAYADLKHPLAFNVGRIEGGDWPSSVPAWCAFEVRAALFPDQDLEAAKREIEHCIAQAARKIPQLEHNPPSVSYTGLHGPGYCLGRQGERAKAVLGRAHRRAYGADLQSFASTTGTDARYFGVFDQTPALVYGVTADNIHGFNERVCLDSLLKNTQAIALFIAHWCAGD